MIPIEEIVYEGKTYDDYVVSLSSSGVPRDVNYSTAVNITFTPIHRNEAGVIEFIPTGAKNQAGEYYIKTFVASDIKTCGDPIAMSAFHQISKIVEWFAIEKGISK